MTSNGNRVDRNRLLLAVGLVAALGLGGTATTSRGEEEADGGSLTLRGDNDLVVPLTIGKRCKQTEYAGRDTPLYTDRPYHTDAKVPELLGLHFCRAKRHGRDVWILEAKKETTLYAIATERHGLEERGWELVDTPVRISAAGLDLDRLYEKEIDAGRYAIRYGRASTAHPIFWNNVEAQIAGSQRPSQ